MGFLFTFLHFLGFIALAALVAGEFLLLRQPELNLPLLKRVDGLYGLMAAVVLTTGIFRIFYEKGWDYYSTSHVFWAKMTLFVAVGAVSMYPTIRFQRAKTSDALAHQPLRRAILVQLLLLPLIVFCAIWMARGFY